MTDVTKQLGKLTHSPPPFRKEEGKWTNAAHSWVSGCTARTLESAHLLKAPLGQSVTQATLVLLRTEGSYERELTSKPCPFLERRSRQWLQVEGGWGGSALGNGPASFTDVHLPRFGSCFRFSPIQRFPAAPLILGETGILNEVLEAGKF